MTIEICKEFCLDKGFEYAGVQLAYQCFCGNTSPPERSTCSAFADKCYNVCDMKCSGNSSQTCGGTWAMNVYSTGKEG